MATVVPTPIPHLLTVEQAAIIVGIKYSTMRKAFMSDRSQRPTGIPEPPPHERLGRRVMVIARYLENWATNLGAGAVGVKKRGRPSKAEVARRQQQMAA